LEDKIMANYAWHQGGNGEGEKWVLTGADGCRNTYEVYFCAPFGAVVEIRSKLNYDASNDSYGCPGGIIIGNQKYLQTAYINNGCFIFCDFGSGLAGASVKKIGLCGCSETSCRVDCASAPDGFCCIDNSLTDRLLQIIKS
jgi:hypothetical protein